ncbi:uncharacterized protein LOC131162660 [Malania oleifera]|uniref:uncharacterized protein LOC131162660 n=1 Tax=Malania oleifera TaxID=397392 RepID=UPI0025AE7221|nr:uncharacterized protein LOC131162660 [Malania oleifera]
MAEIALSFREQGGPTTRRGYTFEKFTKMNPPTFLGGSDAAVAENWKQEIEKMLMVLHCTNEQMVLYAAYKHTGEAERWWTTTRLLEEQRQVLVAMTWCRFKEIFFVFYFPAIVRKAKVAKFLGLTKGNLTVQQYAVKFIELSCFAPYIVPDEVKKVRMLERGLRWDIYKHMVVLKLQDFSELVDRATMEEEREQKDAEASSQRDVGTSSQRKRPESSGFQTSSRRGRWRGDTSSRGGRQEGGDHRYWGE